jgi:hypothetical protein
MAGILLLGALLVIAVPNDSVEKKA